MIQPKSKKIEEILGTTSALFSVPKYQRNFDWGKSELQELIDDLKSLQGKKKKDLFLGSFIFDISDPNEYKIVDGQQRLTTISILFIAIREQAKKINEIDLSAEAQKFISTYSPARGINSTKLKVSKNIIDIFELMVDPHWKGDFPEKIGGVSIKRQNNKIRPIYSYIKDSISMFNSQELREFMLGLLDTYVVVLDVDSDQDIFSVFERTNARGLDLNIGDLLKNYIFSYREEQFEDKWIEIVDNANGGLPRMLKYFWISRKGHILQSNLYKALKLYVEELDTKQPKSGINIFVDDLFEFSRFYLAVNSQKIDSVKDWLEEMQLYDLSKNEDYYYRIARVFQALKLFRVTQAYPVIYSIFKLYKDKKTTKCDNLFKVLEIIEKYHFVNNVICGRIGNEVEKYYADSAKTIFSSEKDFVEEINIFISGLSNKRALKDEFISNFIENITYSKINITLINYVFDRINNFDKKGPVKGSQYVSIFSPEKDLHKRNFNIEHFLPQSSKKKYPNDEEHFDKIGNLLVISRHTNSTLQDMTPAEKIDLMLKDKKYTAHLRYFDEFVSNYNNKFNNWGISEIEERSIEIATNGFSKIWNF